MTRLWTLVVSLALPSGVRMRGDTGLDRNVQRVVTGFLVMFMQVGFAIVETGLCRVKNANHTMMMNFMVYGVGMLAFWLIGFGIQEGGVGGVANLGNSPVLSREFVVTLFGKPWGLWGQG